MTHIKHLLILCLLLAPMQATAAQTTEELTAMQSGFIQSPLGKSAPKKQTVRGIISARNRATIASPVTAKITDIPHRTGAKVSKGAPLILYDCDQEYAEHDQALATLEGATASYESAKKLLLLGSIGELEMSRSKADFHKSSAELAIRKAKMKHCVVRAPYPSIIEEIMAQPHETITAGTPLIRIHDPSSLEVTLIVPSQWLSWLVAGQQFRFQLDETSEWADARIDYLPAYVEANSQTVTLKASIYNKPTSLIAGMSGNAVFE